MTNHHDRGAGDGQIAKKPHGTRPFRLGSERRSARVGLA